MLGNLSLAYTLPIMLFKHWPWRDDDEAVLLSSFGSDVEALVGMGNYWSMAGVRVPITSGYEDNGAGQNYCLPRLIL
jgi:hypothetical protein